MNVDLRSVMRRFPTGVTVVTTTLDGRPKGFTATAFSSVSIDPPLVLVCVHREARTHAVIARAGCFCINLLALEQEATAADFATHDVDDPFLNVAYHPARSGSPVLDAALAYLDCEVTEEHSAGTHTIFVGGVLDCGQRDGAPLGYFNGGYRDFGCRIP